MGIEKSILLNLPFSFKRRLRLSAEHLHVNNILYAFVNAAVETFVTVYLGDKKGEDPLDEEELFRILDFNNSNWATSVIDSVSTNDQGEYDNLVYDELYEYFTQFFHDIEIREMMGLYAAIEDVFFGKKPEFESHGWEADFMNYGEETIMMITFYSEKDSGCEN